jgi:hypothetical protein
MFAMFPLKRTPPLIMLDVVLGVVAVVAVAEVVLVSSTAIVRCLSLHVHCADLIGLTSIQP